MKKIRAFRIKYYLVLESGKEIDCQEIIVGCVKRGGSFSGAVFGDDGYEGEVNYTKKELELIVERELILVEK